MSKSDKKRNKKHTPKPINRDLLTKIVPQPLDQHWINDSQIHLYMFYDRLRNGKLELTELTIKCIEGITERVMVACEYFLSESTDNDAKEHFYLARSLLKALSDVVTRREEKDHPTYIANAAELKLFHEAIPKLLDKMESASVQQIVRAQRKAILAARKYR